jgi:hypothetical protein
MTDRELLEMAAKAYLSAEHLNCEAYMIGFMSNWNPLTDDGDALRLAVDLSLDVHINQNHVEIFSGDLDDYIDQTPIYGDVRAATRRAIVRAAAAIGSAL